MVLTGLDEFKWFQLAWVVLRGSSWLGWFCMMLATLGGFECFKLVLCGSSCFEWFCVVLAALGGFEWL